MGIAENLKKIRTEIPGEVCIIAVSKFKPLDDILAAYQTGQRDFGENYVQEMVIKAENLPQDIRWHFIGHLQRNKVKYIAPFVTLIHSVDSLKLLAEIDKQAAKQQRKIECLLQVHVADEETKTGMSPEELVEILENKALDDFSNVKVKGIMGMSTFTDDLNQVKKEFETIVSLFERAKQVYPDFSEISMGMSGDYLLAVACGSTMVRIGSTIFGTRK